MDLMTEIVYKRCRSSVVIHTSLVFQESTETIMKSLIVFACLMGIAIGATIDYGNCRWHYGGATSMQYCDPGFVGVGSCGNQGQNRCNGQAFGIKCCRINNGGKLSNHIYPILSLMQISWSISSPNFDF